MHSTAFPRASRNAAQRAACVDFLDYDVPAADARAGDGKLFAVGEKIRDARRVRVRVDAEIGVAELDVHAVFARQVERVFQPLVVREHPEQAGDDAAVGRVSAPRRGERAVKLDQHARVKRRASAANAAREQSEAHGACGVRA